MGGHPQMDHDLHIRELREQITLLDAQVKDGQAEIARLQERISKLEAALRRIHITAKSDMGTAPVSALHVVHFIAEDALQPDAGGEG